MLNLMADVERWFSGKEPETLRSNLMVRQSYVEAAYSLAFGRSVEVERDPDEL